MTISKVSSRSYRPRTRVRTVQALVLAALLLPQAALAFTSINRLRVNPVDANVFEVVGEPGTNGPEYWCAAADYAQRQLRAAWRAPLYIARTRGPSVTTGRRSAVQFTLNPTAAGVTPTNASVSLNALRTGNSMSVQLAHTYCQMRPSRF